MGVVALCLPWMFPVLSLPPSAIASIFFYSGGAGQWLLFNWRIKGRQKASQDRAQKKQSQ